MIFASFKSVQIFRDIGILKKANSCLSTRVFSARIARGGLNCCFCHWFPKGVRFLKRGMYMEEPP